ncbi:MAG TPA: hypothetical protein VK849_02830 [Longimicrobiales bacterium]|nr:hypothetical protein [Longimicrobiales bacterium]
MRGLAPVEALVQVGDVEMRYVRAGQGSPVILLTDEDPAAAARTPLHASLATSFRVVSAAPSPDVPIGTWLLCLIDGLGLEGPALVVASMSATWAEALVGEAEASCGGHVRHVARAHPGRPIPALIRLDLHRTAKARSDRRGRGD